MSRAATFVLLLMAALVLLPCFFGLDGIWATNPTADLGSSVLTGVCLAGEIRHLRVLAGAGTAGS